MTGKESELVKCNMCGGPHKTGACFKSAEAVGSDREISAPDSSDSKREDGLSDENIEYISLGLQEISEIISDMENGLGDYSFADLADRIEQIDSIVGDRNASYRIARERLRTLTPEQRQDQVVRLGLYKEWVGVVREIFKP